ncbi:MAG: response regulator [Deltaproteobacteria bacterium]|nr:response regulator [Deltaproteobacteria bacterium]
MKILVVDDSKAMRMIVLRTLRQAGYGDHTIAEAGNGKEALDILHKEPYDLVLSDWNMPEMTGIELLGAIRAEKLPCRFGFITSEGTGPMREQATAAGAEFLVAKPFTVESFQSVLRGVLGA